MDYPIQNQKLFDKVKPLAGTIYKKKCDRGCTDDDIEFTIFDYKLLEYFFRFITAKKYSNIQSYMIANISNGLGHHTQLYIDEDEKFHIVHSSGN